MQYSLYIYVYACSYLLFKLPTRFRLSSLQQIWSIRPFFLLRDKVDLPFLTSTGYCNTTLI